MKEREALRMWRQGYSRNRIRAELHCSYETLEKWIRAAGLVSPDGDLTRRLGAGDRRSPTPTTFVDRDPCLKCGVRKDIGCKHQRTAS